MSLAIPCPVFILYHKCRQLHTHTETGKAITSDLSHQYNNEGEGFLSQIAMGMKPASPF